MAKIEETLRTDLSHPGDFEKAADGDIAVIKGLKNLQARLSRCVQTVPGTLVHRPTWGVGIKDFQNAPNSIGNQNVLARRLKENFEQDVDVERFVGMRLTTDPQNQSKVTLYVRVEVVGFGEAEMEFIPFGETV